MLPGRPLQPGEHQGENGSVAYQQDREKHDTQRPQADNIERDAYSN
jgi:hypothetical protein